MDRVGAQRTGVSYLIKFELGCKEIDRERAVYEKFVCVHPEVRNWIKFAMFEERHVFISGARRVFE
jgi:crooked neck